MNNTPADGKIIRHAVLLDSDACKGCTNCIKHCPVEAIRVRKGKASITADRCIDCGVCIRVCPHKAKKADSDPLSAIDCWDYVIALPAPALYAQFAAGIPVDSIMDALLTLGFDEVYEVAEAAEIVAAATRSLLARPDRVRPLLSASCPAVARLVQVRFPSLLDHLAPVLAPMELAARLAKERARAAGIQGRIGAIFLTPCPAKVTAYRSPLGHAHSEVDAAIAIKDLYLPLLGALQRQTREGEISAQPATQSPAAAPPAADSLPAGSSQSPASVSPAASSTHTSAPHAALRAGAAGVAWARSEGESDGLAAYSAIAVDGIDRVSALLEEMENGVLADVDFIEALACPGGCIGGPLTLANPALARTRVRSRERERGVRTGSQASPRIGTGPELFWTEDLEARPSLRLHSDFRTAGAMLEELEAIAASLPGLDCGSCGAPSCRALAEDIVRGMAAKNDCIFILRERLRGLTRELLELETIEPPSLDKPAPLQPASDTRPKETNP